MDKRTAKIHAMRCTAGLIKGMDAERFAITVPDVDSEDIYAVWQARKSIVDELYRRATKLEATNGN